MHRCQPLPLARAFAGRCATLLAAVALLLMPVRADAQTGESRINTEVWSDYATDWQGFAFETAFPPVSGPNGCRSPAGAQTIALDGGSVVVSLASGACPVRDESSSLHISDAYIDDGDTLTLRFNPPIHAFFTTYGSVAVGQHMRMRIRSADGRIDQELRGLPSPSAVLGTGHGFNSRIPIQTIELSSSEAGTSVIGNFVGLVAGHGGLGNCSAGRGNSSPCDFGYAYASSLPEGMILHPDGADVIDVDLSGDFAVLTAANLLDDDVGSVSIHARNAGGVDNWGRVQSLTAPASAGSASQFGMVGVAIDGDVVVVGARRGTGAFGRTGRAFAYERGVGGADNWGLVAEFDAVDALQRNVGFSVAVEGDMIVIGDPTVLTAILVGRAQLYRRNGNSWQQIKVFSLPWVSDSSPTGMQVKVSGDTVAIGTPLYEGDAGRVFVYTRDTDGANAWGLSGSLVIDHNQWFGSSLALKAQQIATPPFTDQLIVGAPFHTEQGQTFSGRALGYQRNIAGWQTLLITQRRYIRRPPVANAWLGGGVALAGDRVYVAARGDTASAGEDVRRIYRFPFESASGEPPSVEIRRPDGGVLNDISGGMAAEATLLLAESRGAGAWIIDMDPIFRDGFDP